MKRFAIIVFVLSALYGRAQVTVSVQLPPAGLSLKSQLWNMFINNSSGTGLILHAELRLTEVNSNAQVLTAITNAVSVPPGNQFMNANTWSPIQYNVTDPAYQGFASTDFLPVGRFLACYTLIKHVSDGTERMLEECELIDVEPLSPPQLVYPAYQEAIAEHNPVFNWIPPAPINLFTALNYDLELTEMYAGQTENDAIQQNIPLFNQHNISMTSYPYSAGAPHLDTGKKYAWRILVKNNDAVVAKSETWWFTIKGNNDNTKSVTNDLPFSKLKKDDQPSYAVAQNELKFEYLNETSDTLWNVRVFDVSKARMQEIPLPLDSIPLKRGQNLVRIAAVQLENFADKHIYLLQLRNSRDELWQLKFEYRRTQNE